MNRHGTFSKRSTGMFPRGGYSPYSQNLPGNFSAWNIPNLPSEYFWQVLGICCAIWIEKKRGVNKAFFGSNTRK